MGECTTVHLTLQGGRDAGSLKLLSAIALCRQFRDSPEMRELGQARVVDPYWTGSDSDYEAVWERFECGLLIDWARQNHDYSEDLDGQYRPLNIKIVTCQTCGTRVKEWASVPHVNCMEGARMVEMEDGKYSELSQYEESWVKKTHKDCACGADDYRCGWCR